MDNKKQNKGAWVWLVVKQLGIKDPLEIEALKEIARGSSKSISFFNSVKIVYSLSPQRTGQPPEQEQNQAKDAILEPYDNSELSAISKSALSELTKDD